MAPALTEVEFTALPAEESVLDASAPVVATALRTVPDPFPPFALAFTDADPPDVFALAPRLADGEAFDADCALLTAAVSAWDAVVVAAFVAAEVSACVVALALP